MISPCRFDLISLDERHVLTIARGPVADVLESYRQFAWLDGRSPMDTADSALRSLRCVHSCADAIERLCGCLRCCARGGVDGMGEVEGMDDQYLPQLECKDIKSLL